MEGDWETYMVNVAAYLAYEGFPLLRVEVDLGGRDKLIFHRTPRLEAAAQLCFAGKARVEPKRYSECFGHVRKAMHHARDDARAYRRS